MNLVELKAYEVFKSNFGEKDAEVIMAFIESKFESKFHSSNGALATQDNFVNVRSELLEVKTDIIKWLFIFWAGTVITVLACAFVILKLILDK